MNKVINVPYVKDEYREQEEIDTQSFIEELKEFDWLVYSYGHGSYEGGGDMLWKKEGKYFHHDMGHCSCYGWENDIEMEVGYDSLEELLKNSSESINETVQPLLEALKYAGLS
jgi:hypothetical protein